MIALVKELADTTEKKEGTSMLKGTAILLMFFLAGTYVASRNTEAGQNNQKPYYLLIKNPGNTGGLNNPSTGA